MSVRVSNKVVALPRRAKHARHPRWQSALARLDARVLNIERRFSRLGRSSAVIAVGTRMRSALILSLFVHILVIFGVAFKLPDRSQFVDRSPQLEVVLVNARAQTKPVIADALAQHHLDGGGNTDEARRAQSPLPVMPQRKPASEVKPAPHTVDKPEREARQLLTQADSKTQVETAPAMPTAVQQAELDSKAAPQASDILQRSLEIARLEAKISKDWDAYQKRPRRHHVGARTQEFRFARYVEDWRQKIERVGELNYPQAARDRKLAGTLLVTVAINSDGTVEQISIERPSGHKVLDEAARRIVQLAAPFAPFPAEISKDIDILHITRRWTFTPADQFVSE